MFDLDLELGYSLAQLVVLVQDLPGGRAWHELILELPLLLTELPVSLSDFQVTLHLELLKFLDVTAADFHQLLLQGLNFFLSNLTDVCIAECRIFFLAGDVVQILAQLPLHLIKLMRLDPLEESGDLTSFELRGLALAYELFLEVEALLLALVQLCVSIRTTFVTLQSHVVLCGPILNISQLALHLFGLSLVESQVRLHAVPFRLDEVQLSSLLINKELQGCDFAAKGLRLIDLSSARCCDQKFGYAFIIVRPQSLSPLPMSFVDSDLRLFLEGLLQSRLLLRIAHDVSL